MTDTRPRVVLVIHTVDSHSVTVAPASRYRWTTFLSRALAPLVEAALPSAVRGENRAYPSQEQVTHRDKSPSPEIRRMGFLIRAFVSKSGTV